ncbi:unnamed protein product [Caenorhabditis angaria]|uniref:C-type lectin domain-containing protein n=1 Tax=Caenorhabditis angaria TaxID=860376 RepID=A0A9P1ILR5_9PELO|nr:unnamed protein product [Caenorhabditis angaria]
MLGHFQLILLFQSFQVTFVIACIPTQQIERGNIEEVTSTTSISTSLSLEPLVTSSSTTSTSTSTSTTTFIITTFTTSTSTTTTTTKAPPSCPDNWTKFDRTPTSWCMRVALQPTMEDGTLAVCQALNSSAVVSGFENQNEISTMMASAVEQGADSNSNLFVGAKRTDDCTSSGLTATCTALNSFEWTDPSTTGTDGFQWSAGQPDNYMGTSECVMINAVTELMDDVKGDDTRQGVVCGMYVA